ncbi:MAG: hypothetical protein AB1578_19060 [Thermodesulfobacteriota bacterium]
MIQNYRQIRDRYSDAVCAVTNPQMFRDIQVLLRYIDELHHLLAGQAAAHLVGEAFAAFAQDGDRQGRTH